MLVVLGTRAPTVQAQQAAPRPNIVYILSDDQGWKDIGFHGSDIRTPNIDRLARTGAQLNQFYAEPMCTPSRAALMTGRYPFRYGLQSLVIPAPGTYGLATDEWLLPQALGQAGYRTAIVGKWHLGHADPRYLPRQRGFDYQYGFLMGEIDYFSHSSRGGPDWYRNGEPVVEAGYATQLLGQEAVRLIAQHDPKTPLFLYLAFNAPHTPYQAPQAYLDQYPGIVDSTRKAYAASITAMDDQVGLILAALEQRGMRENTLIIFQSDNGGPRSAMFTGEVDVSKVVLPADNEPYRDGKESLYEGGTRVVALANWPGHIPAGSVVNQPMHMVDMYPTLVALAGGSTAKAKPLDGLDMWPTLSHGARSPRNEVVYNIEPFRAALRQGDWKLIWRATLPSSVELYDLARDSSETTNLALQNPGTVKVLEARIEALAHEAVNPLYFATLRPGVRWLLFGSIAMPGELKPVEAQP